jgi:plastocyanin
MKTFLLLLLLLSCLALAACGGDDDGGGGGGGGGGGSSTQPASGGTEVSMKDIQFQPGEVEVKAGDTVTWVNDDSVGHDVTGDDFSSGETGGMQGGDTYKHTFKKAGTFDYVCKAHPGMEGSVTVK